MISKDLIQRFEEAFKYPRRVNAEEYQKIIQETVGNASENIEKLTIRLAALAFLNILFALGEIDKLDYFGLAEIGDKAIILMILLVTISYTHYDLVFALSKFDQLSVIYKIITKNLHRPIHERGLSKYFLFLPNLYEYSYTSSNGIRHSGQSLLWLLQFLTIIVGIPVGSELIALSNLITLSLPRNSIQFIVFIGWAIITALLNLQTLLAIVKLLRPPTDK